MANDQRAISNCSLGTIIEPGANIDDDYIQDRGLLKTSGSVTISGLITPAVGTSVTFSYTKSGVTRQIPRALRVLSSYADPVTRQTSVELGCKFTYLSDLREQINWKALDDPTNTLTENDAKIITIPIKAQGIAVKCLTELGLTASGLSLTNGFSIPTFDLSPGYVKVLEDLLVSEDFFGYLNTSEVLQVVSLQQEGGTGPVFDLKDLLRTNRIGSGQLPAETVIARYSSLKLKQPQQTEPLGWQEQSNTISYEVEIPYTLVSTGASGSKVFNVLESSTVATNYENVRISNGNTLRLPTERITTYISGSPAHVGNVYSEYLASGIDAIYVTVTKRTVESYEYDENGNEKLYQKNVQGSLAFVLGSVPVPVVFEDGDYVLIDFARNVPLEGERRETSTVGNVQQVTTWTYAPWYTTIAGQQTISTGRDGLDTAAKVLNYLDRIVTGSLVLSDYRVETIQAPRPLGAPTTANINNAASAKGGDPNNGYRTESQSKMLLAMGSATAQRRAEYTPPYVPDDQFAKVGGFYISTPSDADAKALSYARTQNRLAHANRNGMNIQLLPEQLPDAPFSPIILTSGGVSALYRTNGCTWTISSQGVIAGCDALFWGAVGGSGPRWFPVAPGISTLPASPPVVGGQMTVGQVVPVAVETLELESRVRPGLAVQSFDYLPSETITPGPLVVRPRLTAAEVVPPSTALQIRAGLTAAEMIPESATLPIASRLTASEVAPESALLRTRPGIVLELANPILVLNPVLYFDFNNASTLTLSGSEITAISNQGSLPWNLVKRGTGPTLAAWGNGKNCADWGSADHSNALFYNSGSAADIRQLFVVLDSNFGSSFPNYNGLVSDYQSVSFAVTGNPGTAGFDTQISTWFNYAALNGSSSNQITAVLPGLNSRCVLMMKRTDGGAVSMADGFQIGNDRLNGGRGWGGLMGPIAGFSSVLGSTDEAEVISYLMSQWSV